MNESSNASRLRGFAAAHFGLSVLCYVAVTSSELFYSGPIMVMAVGVIFMVLYFPAGMLMGTVAPWARVSTLWELGVAVATQAGIAWVWAGLVLAAVYDPEPSGPLLWLILPTLVLAAPSSLFVPWAIWFLAEVFQVPAGFPGWLAAALLAGLLPPLLYNLGNFCVGRGKAAETQGDQQDRRADT